MLTHLPQVVRTRQLRGCTLPCIIKNGGHYFLIGLDVFEDGIVNCWEMVDLPLLKKKLHSGWIVTSVPDGKKLSKHLLGSFDILNSQWIHSSKSLCALIESLISELNPGRENLFDCKGSSTMSIDGVRTGKLSQSSFPWKGGHPILSTRTEGKLNPHFRKVGEDFFIVDIAVFKDGGVVISGLPDLLRITFNELEQQLTDRNLFDAPKPGDKVRVANLGHFILGPNSQVISTSDLNAAIHLQYARLTGQPDASALCKLAFDAYCAHPTNETRDILRKRYEAVPTHLRVYLGDMDTQDIPIRIAIYGEKEIENWSHYRAAKLQGINLPTLNVPRPKATEIG